MDGMDTLAKALVSVRDRKARLELELQRINVEFANLEKAERSLAVVVEGKSDIDIGGTNVRNEAPSHSSNVRGRGSRGPRTNSARHRLKRLLSEASDIGLTHAEIAHEMRNVSSNTLAAYLSTLVTSGQAHRSGDRYLMNQSISEGAENQDDAPAE